MRNVSRMEGAAQSPGERRMREHTMPRCPYVTLVTHPAAMHVGSGDHLAPDMSFRQRKRFPFGMFRWGCFPQNFRSPRYKLPYPARKERTALGSYFRRVTTLPSVIEPRSIH